MANAHKNPHPYYLGLEQTSPTSVCTFVHTTHTHTDILAHMSTVCRRAKQITNRRRIAPNGCLYSHSQFITHLTIAGWAGWCRTCISVQMVCKQRDNDTTSVECTQTSVRIYSRTRASRAPRGRSKCACFNTCGRALGWNQIHSQSAVRICRFLRQWFDDTAHRELWTQSLAHILVGVVGKSDRN